MRYFSLARIVIAFVLFLAPAAQAAQNVGDPKIPIFVTKYSPVEFSFPKGWYRNKETNPYDLHCFSKDERLVTGVFVFKKTDLSANSTPADILNFQIADIQSKRRNFKLYEPMLKTESATSFFTSVTYSGDKDNSKYHYTFTLIEFKAHPDRFAVVLQVSLPEDWKDVKPILQQITNSARPLKEQK